MPKYYKSLSEDLAEWALAQPLFFTASAPTYGDHVNISPKGLPTSTFRVWGANECAYIDATGSGCETISHIYENNRLTLLFTSFTSTPLILRLFCKGTIHEWNTPSFATLFKKMGKPDLPGARAIIQLRIWKVQTSCGYGVPIIPALEGVGKKGRTWDGKVKEKEGKGKKEKSESLKGEKEDSEGPWRDRKTLGHWAGKQVAKGEIKSYQKELNAYSHDGLPGLRSARRDRWRLSGKLGVVIEDGWLKGKRVLIGEWRGVLMGMWMGLLIGVVIGMLGLVYMVGWRDSVLLDVAGRNTCGIKERADLMWRLYGKREDPMGIWCVFWGC